MEKDILINQFNLDQFHRRMSCLKLSRQDASVELIQEELII